jgi:orotate phosphoribosyltransferase
MDSAKLRLCEILRRTSLQTRDEPVFRLASGKMSRHYVDCKQALSDPEARALVGQLVLERLGSTALDAVGGMELGAYPIATSVSDAIFRTIGGKVRAFVVRKEPKQHGIQGLIAGNVKAGDKTLIVDDVVTAGSSTIKAIAGARQAGLIVDRVIVLIDREEEDGRKNIEAQGVTFEALTTLSELLNDSHQGAVSPPHSRYSKARLSTIVGKWGNQLAIPLPQEIVEATNLSDGECVEVKTQNGDILIPLPVERLTLEELFRGKTPEQWRASYAGAFDWGPHLGREIVEE